jgi:hypothetical protein
VLLASVVVLFSALYSDLFLKIGTGYSFVVRGCSQVVRKLFGGGRRPWQTHSA